MVYGLGHRSKEADIVIWDALNYPSLPMLDHSFFFAESVRAVVECKSIWSSAEFLDVREKCRSVRDIVPMAGLTLTDELESIWQEIQSLREGTEHHGALLSKHHIGTAAVFLKGGQSFEVDSLSEETIADVDDSWPDLLLLVEAGRFVVKQYESTGGFVGRGWLELYEFGEDALLAFTNGLLVTLSDRSVHSEEPFYLSRYAWNIADAEAVTKVEFPLHRFVPQRMPLWRTHGES